MAKRTDKTAFFRITPTSISSRAGAARSMFEELDIVRLAEDFDGPDGRIPRGTQGTILQVFRSGLAYQIEFEGPFEVPETVPGELLVADAEPPQR